MERRGPVALAAIASALAFTSAAPAAPQLRPSDRSCLIAWNAPANRANRLRLLAERPIAGLQLLPATVSRETWTKGSTVTQRSVPACILSLAKPGRIQLVTGRWSAAGVDRWLFGRPIPTHAPFTRNVRLLPDGRVTTIDRR